MDVCTGVRPLNRALNRDQADQHIQLINGENTAENAIGGCSSDDNHTSVHIGPANVDETPATTSQNDGASAFDRFRTCVVETVIEAWRWNKEGLRLENLHLAWPIFTTILIVTCSFVHCIRPPNINKWELDCNKISDHWDKRLYGWQFLHKDFNHLRDNMFFFFIYGAVAESILGNFLFFFTLLGLCILMPNEWFDHKLETDDCGAEHIVGLSGIISALGIIAFFLLFYRLLFTLISSKCSSHNLSRNERRNRENWAFLRYGLGFFFSIVLVVLNLCNDLVWPSTDVAHDVHKLGYIQGCMSMLLLLPFCMLRDFFFKWYNHLTCCNFD